MLVDTPLSQGALEKPPQHWGVVLETGFAVFLVSGVIGLLGGAGLVFGLTSRLFSPEAVSHFRRITIG